MLLLNLGIVAGVYAGTRAWRKWRGGTLSVEDTSPSSESEQQLSRDINEYKHHFRVSAVTVVSTSLGYLVYPPVGLVNLGLLTYTSLPLLRRVREDAGRDKYLSADSQGLLICALCLMTGQYFAAALYNSMHHLSGRLSGESRWKTREAFRQAFPPDSGHAWVWENGVEIQRPLAEVRAGDQLIMQSGEWLPVAGEVMAGHAWVTQWPEEGGSRKVKLAPGDYVSQPGLIRAGKIQVRVAGDSATARAERLEQLMARYRQNYSQWEAETADWIDRSPMLLLGFSLLTWPLAGPGAATAMLFGASTDGAHALLALHTQTHLQWLSERGVLLVDSHALEQLPLVDLVLFDKTSALSESVPEVGEIFVAPAHDSDEILAWITAVEQTFFHSLGNALLDNARARGLVLPEIRESRALPGGHWGLLDDGREVYVGHPGFIRGIVKDIRLPGPLARAMRERPDHDFLWLAVAGEFLGAVEIRPRRRARLAEMVSQLRKRGLPHLGLMSEGAGEQETRLAEELGLDKLYTGVHPEQRADLIRGLQGRGHRVCFVGDDPAALRQANVGVFPSDGRSYFPAEARIVILETRLENLGAAFEAAAHWYLRVGGGLGLWFGLGVGNTLAVPLLHFMPLHSSLLRAGVLGLGFAKARSPGWLDRPRSDDSEAEPLNEIRLLSSCD